MLAAALDHGDHLGLAVLVVADGEDGVQQLLARDLLSGAVGIAFAEVGNLYVFGGDARVGADVAHELVIGESVII